MIRAVLQANPAAGAETLIDHNNSIIAFLNGSHRTSGDAGGFGAMPAGQGLEFPVYIGEGSPDNFRDDSEFNSRGFNSMPLLAGDFASPAFEASLRIEIEIIFPIHALVFFQLADFDQGLLGHLGIKFIEELFIAVIQIINLAAAITIGVTGQVQFGTSLPPAALSHEHFR